MGVSHDGLQNEWALTPDCWTTHTHPLGWSELPVFPSAFLKSAIFPHECPVVKIRKRVVQIEPLATTALYCNDLCILYHVSIVAKNISLASKNVATARLLLRNSIALHPRIQVVRTLDFLSTAAGETKIRKCRLVCHKTRSSHSPSVADEASVETGILSVARSRRNAESTILRDAPEC